MVEKLHERFASRKKRLVVGIANDESIAWGCAKAFHSHGAELAVTYLNDKAKTFVQPLAEKLNAPIVLKLDVTQKSEQATLFEVIAQKWGKLDFLLHSSLSHRRQICRDAWWTAPALVLRRPWIFHATR